MAYMDINANGGVLWQMYCAVAAEQCNVVVDHKTAANVFIGFVLCGHLILLSFFLSNNCCCSDEGHPSLLNTAKYQFIELRD